MDKLELDKLGLDELELDELELQACDLSPALLAAAGDGPLYYPWDGHWTAAGHAVVAQRLSACLAEAP